MDLKWVESLARMGVANAREERARLSALTLEESGQLFEELCKLFHAEFEEAPPRRGQGAGVEGGRPLAIRPRSISAAARHAAWSKRPRSSIERDRMYSTLSAVRRFGSGKGRRVAGSSIDGRFYRAGGPRPSQAVRGMKGSRVALFV